MRAATFLILFPLLGRCAALEPDALSAFRQPRVPSALYAKLEHGIPLTLPDVATLSIDRVPGGAIIDYLYSSGGHFHLTANDVRVLPREGVRTDLIAYMTSPSAHPGRLAF